MSVRFSANSSQWLLLPAILPATSPLTVMVWAYVAALPLASGYLDYLSCATSGATPTGPAVSIFNNAGTIRWDCGTSATDNVGSSTPVVGLWYHLALVCSTNSSKILFVNGVQELSVSVAETPSQDVTFGKDGGTTFGTPSNSNSRQAFARIWAAPLNQSEIIAEMRSQVALRRLGLLLDAPLRSANQLYDYSGYNHTFTTGSAAVTTEEGPNNLLPPPRKKKTLVFMPGDANSGGGLLRLRRRMVAA